MKQAANGESAMATQELRLNSLAANGFRLSAEQEEILDQADRFAEKEFWPLQQKMDDEEWWPPEAMPALARMGFLGVTVPAELGGADSDFFTSGLITQGLGALESRGRAQLRGAREPVREQHRAQRLGRYPQALSAEAVRRQRDRRARR